MRIEVHPDDLANASSAAVRSAADLLELTGGLDVVLANLAASIGNETTASAIDELRTMAIGNLLTLAQHSEDLAGLLSEAAAAYRESDTGIGQGFSSQ